MKYQLSNSNKNYAALAVFAVLVFAFYGNTLWNGFVQDDHAAIEENRYIQSLRYLPKVITGCIEYGAGECEGAAVHYRPLQSLSYMLTYQISSAPWFFHLVNLLYFLCIVFLSFLLALVLTKNFFLSLFAAFLFLVHPMNGQVVNWVSAVPELLLAIFVLLAMLFYVKDRQVSFGSSSSKLPSKYFLGAAAFYLLAMLSKEPAVLLPALFLFLDLFFFRIPVRKFFGAKEIQRYAFLFGAFLLYIVIRIAALQGLSRIEPYYSSFSIGERIYAFFALFADYLGKLTYPKPALFFYTFEKTSDLLSVKFLFSFLAVFAFFAIAFLLVRKNKTVYALSFTWIFVFLVPVLFFIDNLGEAIFSERYLFLSSIGFAFLGGSLANAFWQKSRRWKVALFFMFVVIGGVAWGIVYRQNGVWKNDESLYRDILLKNPRADTMRFNYAVMLRSQRDFEAARAHFAYLAENSSQWPAVHMAYLHLGDYAQEVTKDIDKAMEYYRASLALSGGDWKASFAAERLGMLYAGSGELAKAAVLYCQAFQLNPTSNAEEQLKETISRVDSDYGGKAGKRIYEELGDTDVFARSRTSLLKFEEQTCDKKICILRFRVQEAPPGIILPFLIIAVPERGDAFQVANPQMDPQHGVVSLEVPTRYEDAPLRTMFPLCGGVYYEVEVRS